MLVFVVRRFGSSFIWLFLFGFFQAGRREGGPGGRSLKQENAIILKLGSRELELEYR